MNAKQDDSRVIWCLTDGKIGDKVQCEGVAQALGGMIVSKTINPGAPWQWLAPAGLIPFADGPNRKNSPISPPFPDVVIASGRRAIPYARVIKKHSHGQTYVVLLKDPRITAAFADLIWTPTHDKRQGPNVISTLTSPHGLHDQLLHSMCAPSKKLTAFAKPRLGIVLGGTGAGAHYDAKAAIDLAGKISAAMKSFKSFVLTPSRRTPPAFLDELREQLGKFDGYIWDGEGENPYTDILALSDALIVTSDSHNMVSEATATRAPIYIWKPEGLAPKLGWFLSELEELGRIRKLDGPVELFKATPIDATQTIADTIREGLEQFSPAKTGVQ